MGGSSAMSLQHCGRYSSGSIPIAAQSGSPSLPETSTVDCVRRCLEDNAERTPADNEVHFKSFPQMIQTLILRLGIVWELRVASAVLLHLDTGTIVIDWVPCWKTPVSLANIEGMVRTYDRVCPVLVALLFGKRGTPLPCSQRWLAVIQPN